LLKKKGRRAANVTMAKKHLLLELIQNHASITENKETDRVSVAEKTAAWKVVAQPSASS